MSATDKKNIRCFLNVALPEDAQKITVKLKKKKNTENEIRFTDYEGREKLSKFKGAA